MAVEKHTDNADRGWDNYAERVLRNEGRLEGLEGLVAETRAADKALIEQRSDSLARELERRATALLELVTARADAVLALGREERAGDRRAVHDLRELYDTAIRLNFEQSHTEIESLRDIHNLNISKVMAQIDQLAQQVQARHESDREARQLQASENVRHFDQLNHADEKRQEFQANSVTRELYQADKDAAIAREGLLRDQIIALDRTMLTMSPMEWADKAHGEMVARTERAIEANTKVLDGKITSLGEKVGDLRSYRDTTAGRSSGYSAVYAWVATALAIIISAIILGTSLLSDGKADPVTEPLGLHDVIDPAWYHPPATNGQ